MMAVRRCKMGLPQETQDEFAVRRCKVGLQSGDAGRVQSEDATSGCTKGRLLSEGVR